MSSLKRWYTFGYLLLIFYCPVECRVFINDLVNLTRGGSVEKQQRQEEERKRKEERKERGERKRKGNKEERKRVRTQ